MKNVRFGIDRDKLYNLSTLESVLYIMNNDLRSYIFESTWDYVFFKIPDKHPL